ncbi:MAG: ferritin-like domain-containing protein, partial [Candidatus Rokubacteria bacterium]|nr:ferritin-like domain-containing protein [Candidatus Rokubacteria bacterium]
MSVLAVCKDLFFTSRIGQTGKLVGTPVAFVEHPDQLPSKLADARPDLVIVDLTTSGWDYGALFAALERRERVDRPPARLIAADGATMTAEEFVKELDATNGELLRRLAPEDTLRPEVEGDLNVLNLLKVALKNEIEASEIAARWMVTTDDPDVKLAFARQVGDEAKHYRLVVERLRELGFDARGFNPLAKGYGPLFQYLATLRTTVERVAAGQFTREAIAVVKNRQFIEFCERAGDTVTATLYRDVIEPDE